MSESGERIVSLEVQAEEAERQRDVIFDKLEAQDNDLRAIRNDVHEIKQTVASYRGFFAGFSFALAAMGGIVGAALTAVWGKITGQP